MIRAKAPYSSMYSAPIAIAVLEGLPGFFAFFYQIRTIYATRSFNPYTICDKIEQTKTEKGQVPLSVNPYTISGRIEPEAPIVSQIVYRLHLRFWRGLIDFWSRFGKSVQYMRNIRKGPPKMEIAIHILYATKYRFFFSIIHL